MKIGQISLRVFLVFILIGISIGCASIEKKEISGSTTQYNLALEKAQNEMLFLNVVRALWRHPMYFTTLSDIKGSVSFNLQSGAINIPLAKWGKTSGSSAFYSIAPSTSYTTNPIFDVAPLNTKEFIKGILNPVSPETVYYYWRQGWPKGMILQLFVSEIKEVEEEAPFKNCPKLEDSFGKFQREIKNIVESKCELEEKDIPAKTIGPKLDEKVLLVNVKSLVEIQKAELTLARDPENPDKYQLKTPTKTKYVITCDGKEKFQLLSESEQPNSRTPKSSDATSKMYLRSPEAILYYLGEIMRLQAEEDKAKEDKIVKIPDHECPRKAVLFDGRKATEKDTNPPVAVEYEGTKYVIPQSASNIKCPPDESMHVLSLMSLLIAKQTAASELPPPTGVTTTIGK